MLDKYNKSIYKNNLMNIYKKVIHTPVTHTIDQQVLASHFLEPDTFSLLKWCDDVD